MDERIVPLGREVQNLQESKNDHVCLLVIAFSSCSCGSEKIRTIVMILI